MLSIETVEGDDVTYYRLYEKMDDQGGWNELEEFTHIPDLIVFLVHHMWGEKGRGFNLSRFVEKVKTELDHY